MKWINVFITSAVLCSGIVYADGEHSHAIKADKQQAPAEIGICPVTHLPARKEFNYAYKGKTYYFCCNDCIEKFKQEPEKYISKIKEIKLEAFRFGFSPDPVVVKQGDIVRLEVTSRDVTHGVHIKQYGINVAVKKGETKKIEFFAKKAGKFDITCSVYCGPGHPNMRGRLIVEK